MYILDIYVREKKSQNVKKKKIVYEYINVDISTVSFMIQADVMIWPHPGSFSIRNVQQKDVNYKSK